MEFEWNPDKEAENLEKHRVGFELGQVVFEDLFGIEDVDAESDPSEVRWNLVGLAHGRELFVTWTQRGTIIRIISARRAERHERERYWKNRQA